MFRPVGLPSPSEPILLNTNEQPMAPGQQAAPLLPPPKPPSTALDLVLGSAGAVAATAMSRFIDDDGNVNIILQPSPFEQTKPPDSPEGIPTKP